MDTKSLLKNAKEVNRYLGTKLKGNPAQLYDAAAYLIVNGGKRLRPFMVMKSCEILGGKLKPIIGIPVYDEHSNQILWAQDNNLGLLARNTKQIITAIGKIERDYNKFQENLANFAPNFVGNGAENTAMLVKEILENTK